MPSLISALLLLMLSTSACGVAEVDESTPAFRVKNHYAYIVEGKYDEAYAMLSTRHREEYYPTLEDFIADIEAGRYPTFYDLGVRETTYDSEEEAVVSWQAKSNRNGKELLMNGDILLVLEDDTWMIDSFFAAVAP